MKIRNILAIILFLSAIISFVIINEAMKKAAHKDQSQVKPETGVVEEEDPVMSYAIPTTGLDTYKKAGENGQDVVQEKEPENYEPPKKPASNPSMARPSEEEIEEEVAARDEKRKAYEELLKANKERAAAMNARRSEAMRAKGPAAAARPDSAGAKRPSVPATSSSGGGGALIGRGSSI